MLTELAVQYGQMALGAHFAKLFGFATALIVGLLLLSAVNTAVVALVGLLYLLARDGEMPQTFAGLNRHGVPWLPLLIATALPVLVVAFSPDQISLMELYAIGEDIAATILDQAATMGVDILMLGSPNRNSLLALLKGNVVTEVAKNLPDNIQLIIHG